MPNTPECIRPLLALGISWDDAHALRRISMTLNRWFELECGNENGGIEREEKWAIERAAWPSLDKKRWWNGSAWDCRAKRRTYSDDEKANYIRVTGPVPIDMAWRETGSKPYWLNSRTMERSAIADRERGAEKRLAAIMARYPTLQSYIQGDPRGAALYIIRPGDVPAGSQIDSCYSNGIAVYK